MDTTQTLAFLGIGALLGAAGQGVRVFVGLKKQITEAKRNDKKVREWFDGRQLGISFVLGALAGLLASLTQYAADVEVTRTLLFGFAAAGYAGADFINGLMEKWLP